MKDEALSSRGDPRSIDKLRKRKKKLQDEAKKGCKVSEAILKMEEEAEKVINQDRGTIRNGLKGICTICIRLAKYNLIIGDIVISKNSN